MPDVEEFMNYTLPATTDKTPTSFPRQRLGKPASTTCAADRESPSDRSGSGWRRRVGAQAGVQVFVVQPTVAITV